MTQNPSLTSPYEPYRYSPLPKAEYAKSKTGRPKYTAACSGLIESVTAWNLTYLSHDLESRKVHPDPQFHVHVLRTLQTPLDGSGSDLIGLSDLRTRIEFWLTMPAPRFVYLIRRHPHLERVPLYLAYGQTWLDMIEQRSRHCRYEEDLPDTLSDPFASLEEARQALLPILSR